MSNAKRCTAMSATGDHCRAYARSESRFCFRHDPDSAQEAAEASRVGGLRRRSEDVMATVYDLGNLTEVQDVRRVLQIAVMGCLELPNSISRSRALGYLSWCLIQLHREVEVALEIRRIQDALGLDGRTSRR